MTTYSVTVFPKLKVFIPGTNAPAVGYKLYTYAAGTSTPLVTYSDNAGTPNTNPVVLDANGEANVRLGSSAYKFVLKTDLDATAPGGTIDNLRSPEAYTDTLRSDLADHNGAELIGYGDQDVKNKLDECPSVKDAGADNTGINDSFPDFLSAAADAGPSGSVFVPAGLYRWTNTAGYLLSLGRLVFDNKAIIVPDPGTAFIIDCEIEAGNCEIFRTGKWVTACDCKEGTTNLRTWGYGFEASDAGKSITLPFGGAYTGAAAVPNFVQNRLPFTTTIAAYIDSNNVTLTASPTTPIRQDYVVDGGYDYLNTGIAIVGNGTVECTTKVTRLNVNWFGAGGGLSDAGHMINKATHSVSRRYGGTEIYFPDAQYNQSIEIGVDVPRCYFNAPGRKSTLFRNNSIPLEKMNSIRTVWRGRYGGGGPVKSAENWTNNGWPNNTPVWMGDWHIMSGLTLDNLIVNGNVANQPALTPGSGLDSWDAGVSCLYTKHVLIKDTCEFVNHLRWGVALSTLSDYGVCEDGTYFENCQEGAFYAETSKYCICGAINSLDSPAAGWNMGAVTYLAMEDSVINCPIIKGGNNGIYVRQGSKRIVVNVGVIDGVANNGVWLFDESLGSNRLEEITVVNGNASNCGNDGLHAQYVDGLTILGVRGKDNAHFGAYVAQSTEVDISHSPLRGAAGDIIIDAGTVDIQAMDNLANLKLQGSSTIHMTASVPSNKTFTDTSSGTGYLRVIDLPNDGAGHVFTRFNGGVRTAANNYLTPNYFGTYATYVSTDGKLRIKSSAPASDGDGTVLGTQS